MTKARTDTITVSLVTPAYNEEEMLPHFFQTVIPILDNTPQTNWEIIVVDDGSADGTSDIVDQHHGTEPRIKLVRLARNFGKDPALVAGLTHAQGDVVIPLDCDLQDNPAVIPTMIAAWRDGYDVVVGVKASRDETFLKRFTSRLYYRILHRLCGIKLDHRRGEYRLMDRTVLHDFLRLKETDRWNKGLLEWVARNVKEVPFDRPARIAGTTKFTVHKMIAHAVDGVTSMSAAPVRMLWKFGLACCLPPLAYLLYTIYQILTFGLETVSGWLSLICIVIVMGSFQLIALGIIGEYIGRLFVESKNRPLYLIDTTRGLEDASKE